MFETFFDVSYNTCKLETYEINVKPRLRHVHRKGAACAFGSGHFLLLERYHATGQSVIIGGSMVLVHIPLLVVAAIRYSQRLATVLVAPYRISLMKSMCKKIRYLSMSILNISYFIFGSSLADLQSQNPQRGFAMPADLINQIDHKFGLNLSAIMSIFRVIPEYL